jgi:uncharacterized membrane protein (GlpM family)
MESLLSLKITLGFAVGGIWVALTTAAAERLGSKVGGFIGGLPSTAVIALLFVGLTQSPKAAAEATTLIPFVQGINGLFLLFYMFAATRSPTVAFVGGISVWFVLAGVVAASGMRAFHVSVAAWILLTFSCYLVAERLMVIPSQSRVVVRTTLVQALWRALFGGVVVAFAVLVSKLLGPVYGGIFAAFPAMFISTLIVTHRTRGAAFSRAVAKSLLFSGMVNIPLYAIFVRYSYPWAGLAAGTVMALVTTALVGFVTFRLVMARAS